MRAVYDLVTGRTPAPWRSRAMPKSSPPDVLIAARWPVGGIRTHLGYNHPALVEAGRRCTVVVPDDDPALRCAKPCPAEFVPVPVRGRACARRARPPPPGDRR
ncbi:MAG: hypothetical protein U0797_07195 [Gemmataceae bacterium]